MGTAGQKCAVLLIATGSPTAWRVHSFLGLIWLAKCAAAPITVVLGLDPRIHAVPYPTGQLCFGLGNGVDCQVRPGNDE